jgi:hypothetical protein
MAHRVCEYVGREGSIVPRPRKQGKSNANINPNIYSLLKQTNLFL